MNPHDHRSHVEHDRDPPASTTTAVLDVSGLHWATEQAVIERTLKRLDGVTSVVANAVAQTATVAYDPDRTNLVELRHWVKHCGYHCAGQSVPGHICHPMREPQPNGTTVTDHVHLGATGPTTA